MEKLSQLLNLVRRNVLIRSMALRRATELLPIRTRRPLLTEIVRRFDFG